MINTTLCYIEKDNKYLMLHRTKKENDENHDKWIGVGGKFEADESPEDCMRREVLEETGFIRSQSAGKVSRKQAKFIEDFLLAIHLIDIEGNIDDNNIRSRLHSLMKNYDSIEELTEELDYKRSPNNEGGTRLY